MRDLLHGEPNQVTPLEVPVRVSMSHNRLLSIYGPRSLTGQRFTAEFANNNDHDILVLLLKSDDAGKPFGNYMKDADEVRFVQKMPEDDLMPECGPTPARLVRARGGAFIEIPTELNPARAKRRTKQSYSHEERLIAALAVVNECTAQLQNVRLRVDNERTVRAFTQRTTIVELKSEEGEDES